MEAMLDEKAAARFLRPCDRLHASCSAPTFRGTAPSPGLDRRVTASPSASVSRPARPWVFTALGAVTLLAVLIGFGRTYAVPMAAGSFTAPFVVHLHGALALAWILLFLAQPLLVRAGRVRWHRTVGQVGLPVAVGVAVTMVPAGMAQVARDVAAGGGATAVSSILGVVTSALMFVALVMAGIVTRRNREAHARWLLLATLVVAWPAWFRWRHYFPGVPRPEIWFALVAADVWIVVAMVRDRLVRGAVHPVLAWGGAAVIVEHALEAIAFDSAPWRSVAQWVHALLGG